MATLSEKIGYGLGDMSSSMFWKIFSYYLPFFLSNIFGLGLDQVALLLVVTRIWDAVSDPMMGILSDRTHSRWGSYRPYLLFMALPFAVCGVLVFTTPQLSQTGKLVWAYVTYILMMTVYTGINVPYGAMLGVMTGDSDTKTIFSSFRMFFAYVGSFVVLFCWEPLCNLMGGYDSPEGWRNAMTVVAACCCLLFLLCFLLTSEKVRSENGGSVFGDLGNLVKNAPWWILIGAVLCSNFFMTVRGSTVAYYFSDVLGSDVTVRLGKWNFLFYAGLFLSIGEISNMAGVILCPSLAGRMGKKGLFMVSFAAMAVFSILFYFIPVGNAGLWGMILLQVIICILTGLVSPLVWSMYADVSEYSRDRFGSSSTGLIFSSASMAQKFGGAFGGAAVMWILGAFGYATAPGAVQSPEAINGLKVLMSWIPAAIAVLGVFFCILYPLGKSRMKEIHDRLENVSDNVN